MDIINNGYEWPRTDKVCIDCGMPHTCSLTKVCEVCNEIRRKLAYEDRIQDDIEREVDEKDLRDTNRSIISSMYPF